MASVTMLETSAETGAEPRHPIYGFAFSEFLKREYKFGLDPNRPFCKAFREGHCPLGASCPDKHPTTHHFNNIVCKHWLRGLCKKGDACEFLHEYNLRRMPECRDYSRTLSCQNGDECLFQHVDPLTRMAPCPNYDNGFCPLGPLCAKKHIRKTLCRFYLAGFCPNGRQCKEGEHPRWVDEEKLPKPTRKIERTKEEMDREREKMRDEMAGDDDRDWDRRDGGRRDRGRGKGRFGNRRRALY